MSYPALQAYIERLASDNATSSSLRLGEDGQVEGHIFNCWLGSSFQTIRELESGVTTAYAGRVRGVSAEDQGLPLWSYLDGAASDDESVALDRLCRTLHALTSSSPSAFGRRYAERTRIPTALGKLAQSLRRVPASQSGLTAPDLRRLTSGVPALEC